jgi:hypothetical protein
MRHLARITFAALLVVNAGVIAGTSVSPAGETVPANLLRIELQLDRPRGEPMDLRQVRLLRGGAVIEDALLGLPLPSRDGHVVTLLLHPGRIKTGVGPNLALGLALHEGDRVTLEVDDPPVRKTWWVTAPQRQPIVVADWPVAVPAAGSREPLGVTPTTVLGRDAADLIGVADAAGRRVAGSARMAADGSQWLFIPAAPWRSGSFTLRVHPALEDVAGNRQCAAFEQRHLSGVDCRDEGQRSFVIGEG